jgi:hypothetical protein
MRNMEEEFKSFSVMERIEFVRSGEKLTLNQFGESIGFSQQGYTRLKNKGYKLQQYKMVALAVEAVYEVDHRWILTGET